MRWLALVLAGPGIWAGGFAGVYALHGTGCAVGWPDTALAVGIDAHTGALWAGWLATLGAGGLLLRALPRPEGPGWPPHLPRTGAWIGLAATAFTLSPVALASSC